MKNKFEFVRDMLSEEIGISADAITLDTNLVDDLKADSMSIAVIVSNIEDEYSIEISDEDVKGIRTVGDIVEYLNKHAK